jgi:hypothetical protein
MKKCSQTLLKSLSFSPAMKTQNIVDILERRGSNSASEYSEEVPKSNTKEVKRAVSLKEGEFHFHTGSHAATGQEKWLSPWGSLGLGCPRVDLGGGASSSYGHVSVHAEPRMMECAAPYADAANSEQTTQCGQNGVERL